MKDESLLNFKLLRPALFKNCSRQISPFLRKLKFLGAFVLALNANSLHAQVNTYGFTSSTGNTLESGGFTNLLGSFMDDDVSSMANIGFSFNYGGANYTDFSVTSNGVLAFGTSASTDYNNVIANFSGPYLTPYWDDNYTDADGNVQYKLMGVAGSRKLVVDYNLSYLGNTGTADKHFQIWLFETTNKIMFVYGTGNNLNGGFSIAAIKNGITDFISISTATNTSSTVTQNDNNTTWPGAGRAYVINGGATLPVSFLNLSGYKDGSRNLLQWSTATENNNRGFEVQRSADGINYSVLGFVNSQAVAGNSSSVLNYQFTDNNTKGSRQYYRLRQIDMDTRSKLSSIVSIDGDKLLTLKIDGFFPNPASTIINVIITTPNRDKLTLFVTDITGKVVMRKETDVVAGRNTVPVDISYLANNTYILKATAASGANETFKIEVIK